MKKFLQIFFALTIVAIMLFSASSVAFAANSFVTTGKGDKVVNFTVKVNKNQKPYPRLGPMLLMTQPILPSLTSF